MKPHFSFYKCGTAYGKKKIFLRWPFHFNRNLFYVMWHHRIHIELGFENNQKTQAMGKDTMTRLNQSEVDKYLDEYMQDMGFKKKPEPDNISESKLQIKIEQWAKDHGYPCLSIRQSVTKYPRIAHLFKDYPDITIALPKNRTVRIELKSKKGEAKKGQKQMALQLLQLGHEWYQCKSYKQFLVIMEENAASS